MKRFVAVIFALIFSTSALAAPATPHDFSGFYAQLEEYLVKYHDPAVPYDPADVRGYFSYQPRKAYDLYGSIDMVYVLWTIGELEERTTAEGRAEWVTLIQSYQDPDTGWFNRGNETAHFKEHATAYATGALALLGAKPLHPFKWKSRMTGSERDLGRWLRGTWWDVVWVGSHQGGGVAAALAMTGEANDEWFDWYLSWLDREVNPKTGLWQRAFYNTIIKRPNQNDLGGAAHYWWIYEWAGRPVPHPRAAIDTILSLQRGNGLWDDNLFAADIPLCIDLDAVNGLRQAHLQIRAAGGDYRTADIVRAEERYLEAAAAVLNPAGNLDRHYRNAHDLPGALIAIAEADRHLNAIDGKSRLATRRPWRSVLEVICWL